MNLNSKPIKDWFGFTRRERRSTFTLLLIVVIIISIRYTIPDTKIKLEDITDTILLTENRRDPDSLKDDLLSEARTNIYSHQTSFKSKPKSGVSGYRYPGQKQQLIEINKSDSATLVSLPGIGPVLSARIIKYRKLLGGYARIEQLKEVYGILPETFELIKNRVTADSTFITRIDINTADYRELSHIRYFEKYEVSSILKYRQLKGRITRMEELIDNKIITKEKAEKVGPYLKFND